MNNVQKFFKNTGILVIAYALSYFFAFMYTISAARYLGVEQFGVLSFAIAFTGILGVFGDLGLNALLTREIARDKKLAKKYVYNILPIKIILGFITFLIIFIMINLMGYSNETINVVYLIAVYIVLSNLSTFLYAIFQGFEKMEYQSLGQILSSSLLLLGILISIYYKLDIIAISTVYLIVSFLVLGIMFLIFQKKFFMLKLNLDKPFWKETIKTALPLSFALIFSMVYFRIDSVILSILQGNQAVGLYTASYRLIEALLFIPAIFSISIYPVISRFYVSSEESLKIAYRKSFKYLLIISLPIAVGTTLLAKDIITFIYGSNFDGSIIALQILVWAIPLLFLTNMSRIVLISVNKQNMLLKILFLVMIINIILNIFLVPFFSYKASSFVTVITELLSLLIFNYYLSRFVCEIKIKAVFIKCLIASLLMALFICFINLNLFLVILLSFIVYLIALILLKTFSEDDKNLIKKIFHK